MQVKPVPRGGGGGGGGSISSAVAVTAAAKSGGGGGGGGGGGFAGFVKMHFAEMKKSCPPGASHKEVMEALGKKYRAEKAETKAGHDLEEMQKMLKNVKVASTTTVIDEEEEEKEKEGGEDEKKKRSYRA